MSQNEITDLITDEKNTHRGRKTFNVMPIANAYCIKIYATKCVITVIIQQLVDII
jgi:hypothetical protein